MKKFLELKKDGLIMIVSKGRRVGTLVRCFAIFFSLGDFDIRTCALILRGIDGIILSLQKSNEN